MPEEENLDEEYEQLLDDDLQERYEEASESIYQKLRSQFCDVCGRLIVPGGICPECFCCPECCDCPQEEV